MIKHLIILTLFFSSNAISEDLSEHPGIEKIFSAFFNSIESKNKESFLSLFTNEPVTWVGVYSKESISILRERYGSEVHKPKAVSSTPEEFIENIVSSPFEVRETFDNVSVITDGEVASVSFTYSYFLGDFESNWGLENWQLINSDDGWKISAVNFSMTYSTDPWPKPPQSTNEQARLIQRLVLSLDSPSEEELRSD